MNTIQRIKKIEYMAQIIELVNSEVTNLSRFYRGKFCVIDGDILEISSVQMNFKQEVYFTLKKPSANSWDTIGMLPFELLGTIYEHESECPV